MLNAWYRKEMKKLIPPMIEKWEHKLGVKVESWLVKLMKTKWGTCNPKSKRIILNLELIKKPPHCIEYIVVHEMLHLLERTHSETFNLLMDRHYPNWESVRKELNEFVL